MGKSFARKLSTSILYIVLIHCSFCKAQDYPMVHLTTKDGLPSNTIYSTFTDKKGFVWIGTDKGVARYNGVSFEIFTIQDGLSDNEIFDFYEDDFDRIWFASYNGELSYFQNEHFFNKDNCDFLRNIPISPVIKYFIKEPSDSSFYIINTSETKIINISNLSFNIIPINIKKNVTSLQIVSILKNKTGYEIDGYGSLKGFDYINSLHIYIKDTFENINNSNQKYFTIDGKYKIENSKLVSIYTKEIVQLNNIDSKSIKFFISNLIGTNKYLLFKESNSKYDTILKNIFISYVQKNEKNYWVSTLGNGIFILNINFNTFSYQTFLDHPQFIKKINKELLYVFDNNLNIVDNSSKLVLKVKFNNSVNIKNNKIINDIYKDDKNLFVLTSDSIYVKNKLNTFISIPQCGGARKMLKIDSNLWLFLASGKLYSLKKNKIFNINKYYFDNRVYDFTLKGENVYFSTNNGLYKIIKNKIFSVSQFRNSIFLKLDIIGNDLIAITNKYQFIKIANIDSNKNYKIDTLKNSKCCFNFNKLNDSLLVLNICSKRSILKITNDNFQLYSNSILMDNTNDFYIDSNLCIVLKTNSKINLPFKFLIEKNRSPKIYFSKFAYSQSVDYLYKKPIVKYEDAKNVQIYFKGVGDYNSELTYEYMFIENGKISTSWSEIKGEILSFVKLTWGKYILSIRCKNQDNIYSNTANLNFEILPPFWGTWKFIIFTSFVLISLIYASTKYVINKNKQKELVKYNAEIILLQSEFKALNALMNPHFIFNSLNNIQSLIEKSDKITANKFIGIFSKLIRQNMQNITKSVISMEQELEIIENYLQLEKLRFKDKLNYTIVIDKNIDISTIIIPPLSLQPFVENAIIHGILPNQNITGKIEISVFEINQSIFIQIEDNGKGFSTVVSTNSHHNSSALKNIENRFQQFEKIHHSKIKYTIIDKTLSEYDSTGTIILIEIIE